jgi:hypothetical protein
MLERKARRRCGGLNEVERSDELSRDTQEGASSHLSPLVDSNYLLAGYKMFSSPGFGIVSACPNSDLCEGSSPRPSSSLVRKLSLPGYTQIPTEDCGASSTISLDDEESEQTRAVDPPASSAEPHLSSAQSALPPYLAMFVLVGRLMIYSEKKAISYRSRNRLVRVPSLFLLAALLHTCHPSIPIVLSLTLHK